MSVHHNSSQTRAQLWPKLSTPRLFQTSAWQYMELGFKITSNWLCTSQKSFGKTAKCGASGFSGFRDLAHDGSDRVLVFAMSLKASSPSLHSFDFLCQMRNNVVAPWVLEPRTPTNPQTLGQATQSALLEQKTVSCSVPLCVIKCCYKRGNDSQFIND